MSRGRKAGLRNPTREGLQPLLALFLGLALIAGPVFAQDTGSDQDLRDDVDEQQKRIDELEEQLKELERSLGRPEAPPAPATAAGPDGEEPPPVSDMGKHDLQSPSASNVTYFGSSRASMMPGEKTEVGVHGLVEFQIIHDTVGLNNNRFDTVDIPVDGGPSQTKFSVNPTQFAVSTTTPAGKGQLNTWLSIDLNGELTHAHPRLRIAFGEYVDGSGRWAILAGQAYTTMTDLGAVPEGLDFALPAGLWQMRQPVLRYSRAFGSRVSGEFSLETPEYRVFTDATLLTRWPDFSAAGTWRYNARYVKHFRLAAILRDLGAEDANGVADWALGWTFSGSTKIGLPFLGARDNFKLNLHYGDGYGTMVKGGPQEGIFDVPNSQLETIGIFAAFGGLQHFWSDRYRSNVLFGHVEDRNPDIAAANTLKNTTYASVNFVWTPFPNTKFGVEYLWGQRTDEDGSRGTSNRFLLSSMFRY